MATKKSAGKPYRELEAELQEILTWFESEAFDVDEALNKYERGLELVSELETHLKTAENTVSELKAKFSAAEK